jgi:CBS domain
MSAPIITVDETLPLKEAISPMRSKHIRRLLVTSFQMRKQRTNSMVEQGSNDEKESSAVVPIGIVTLMAIAGNLPMENLDLAEVEIPSSAYNDSSASLNTKNVSSGRILTHSDCLSLL